MIGDTAAVVALPASCAQTATGGGEQTLSNLRCKSLNECVADRLAPNAQRTAYYCFDLVFFASP
jgi:hypothetical protein